MSLRLVLASASPRRRELLAALGVDFDIVPSRVDEEAHAASAPMKLAGLLAVEKASEVWQRLRDEDVLVLGADTVVALGPDDAAEFLAKPTDADDARRMLERLSGREHRVCTGVTVIGRNDTYSVVVATTRVAFRTLSSAEIAAYVASGDPLDKAGAYGIQSGAAAFVEYIAGDYYNVVGLPVAATRELLAPFFPGLHAPPPPPATPFPIRP